MKHSNCYTPEVMPSFKFKPEPRLSDEHARQVERFTGVPYDPEADARIKGWVAFKRYHHALQVAAAAKTAPASPRKKLALVK